MNRIANIVYQTETYANFVYQSQTYARIVYQSYLTFAVFVFCGDVMG